MNLVDYEKYYHSGSEFIIPRDEFEKIIEENQRLNNVLNELEKWLCFGLEEPCYVQGDMFWHNACEQVLDKLNELKKGI